MKYRIKSAEALRYPVLRITFDDGLSGDVDMTEQIAIGPAFARLKDEAYFAAVSVADDGRTYGWNLDEAGREIDFCPDALRIRFETERVEALADRYRARLAAAE
jgi:hypothetical protein